MIAWALKERIMKQLIGNCYILENSLIGFSNEFVEEVIIPEGITDIRERAFYEYYGLKSVVLPDTIKKIECSAFSRCSNLRKIKLPHSLIELNSSFLSGTFDECKQLIEADLSDTQITNLSDCVFNRCKKLQTVKLPRSLVKISSRAFDGCINLCSLELYEGLKILECDFEDNKNLSILNIPKSVIHIEDLSRNKYIKTIMLSEEQYENFKEYLPEKCKIIYKE